jgi:hypothetical protein
MTMDEKMLRQILREELAPVTARLTAIDNRLTTIELRLAMMNTTGALFEQLPSLGNAIAALQRDYQTLLMTMTPSPKGS